MKAVKYYKFGDPGVLKLVEMEESRVEANEIKVEVYSTSVNSGDCHMRSGRPFMARLFAGPITPRQKILGTTYSGKVIQVGPDVKSFSLGDEVFGSLGSRSGAYMEEIVVSEDSIIAQKPSQLTFEEAVSTVFGGLSGKYFLDKADIQKGKSVLVIGASGGVGSYAVQYASALGAVVTGVCNNKSTEFVKSLGAEKVIDYKSQSLDHYNETYDIIFDTVGQVSLPKVNNLLSPCGIYTTTIARFDIFFYKKKDKRFLFDIDKSTSSDLIDLSYLIDMEKIKPLIDKIYDFDEMPEAHRYVETASKKGTVIVNVKK